MMTTALSPVEPVAKFRIGEREPLFWLVSVLFTDEFWQRDNLTQAKYGLFGFGGTSDTVKPAKYSDWPTMYRAVEEWVANDPVASPCFNHAKEAIVAGELSFYSPEPDEWGDTPYHEPERDVDSYQFLQWAERNGYFISDDILNAVRTTIHMAVSRQQSQEREAWAYPTISADDFERLQKRPLWNVGEAIMFVMGRRARSEGKEVEFGKSNRAFEQLLQYVCDAEQAKQLRVIGYDHSYVLDEKRKPINMVMLEAKVEPAEFIAWAKKLPMSLPTLQAEVSPMAESLTPSIPPALASAMPASLTPEMELMFAAMEYFSLQHPDPDSWPMKKIVLSWLQDNAPRYGVELSDNLAKSMDTLMRPSKARVGGLKSTKA